MMMDNFDTDSPLYPTTSRFSTTSQPLPVYGDASSSDAGDEIKFMVELTKIRHLDDLFYVDTKRLKGESFSYKHVYSTLFANLDLGTA